VLQEAASRLARVDGNIADLIEQRAVERNTIEKLRADIDERDAIIQGLCGDLQKKDDLILHQTVEQEGLVQRYDAFIASLQIEIETLRTEVANTKHVTAHVKEDTARALRAAEAHADACQRECDEHRSAAIKLATELIQSRQYGNPAEMAADVARLRQTVDDLQVAYSSVSPEARAARAIAPYSPRELVSFLTVLRKQADEAFHIFRRTYGGLDTASAGPVFDRFLRRVIEVAQGREFTPDIHAFFADVIRDPSPVLFPVSADWSATRHINQQFMLHVANKVWIHVEDGTEAETTHCIKQLFCAAIVQCTSMLNAIRSIRPRVTK
jgi:hypothetical protein